jgi:hypothetical protein
MGNETTVQVPGSLSEFLKDGVEAAECSICAQPFDSTHTVIQIKECGHHFGEECLTRWLKQKVSKGTCPTCRGVLFAKKQTKARSYPSTAVPLPAARPLPPTLFAFYLQPGSIEVSNRAGFLDTLWSLRRLASGNTANELATIRAAIVTSFAVGHEFSTDENTPERNMLRPYIQRM